MDGTAEAPTIGILPRLWTLLLPVLLCVALVYFLGKYSLLLVVALAVILYSAQSGMLYFAGKSSKFNPRFFRSPSERGLKFEELRFGEGASLHGWWIPASPEIEEPATVLFFHGNAGNIGGRLENLLLFHTLGYNVCIFDYRGYGESSGTPTEKGVTLDGLAALELAASKSNTGKVFLFGRSLGGAVAVKIASMEPDRVAGLILENTFLSVAEMALSVFPWLKPVKAVLPFFLTNHWNSLAHIAKVRCPTLLISAAADEIVPPSHMAALFEKGKMAVKEFYKVKGAHHNTTPQDGAPEYKEKLREFIRKVSLMGV